MENQDTMLFTTIFNLFSVTHLNANAATVCLAPVKKLHLNM